ncbi:MAG: hypothetical protein ACK5Y2_10730 [Bdellovibrionales bacterium]
MKVSDQESNIEQNKDGRHSRSHRVLQISGRIRPFVLALIILVAGLLLDNWWWQIGVVIMIVLFFDAVYRYRTLD